MIFNELIAHFIKLQHIFWVNHVNFIPLISNESRKSLALDWLLTTSTVSLLPYGPLAVLQLLAEVTATDFISGALTLLSERTEIKSMNVWLITNYHNFIWTFIKPYNGLMINS